MADRYGLEIRALAETDAVGLADLLALAAAAPGGGAGDAGALAGRIEAVRRQPGVALIAHAWGPPSGVAVAAWRWSLQAPAPSAELLLLLVDPERRRCGVGRLLLKAVAQAARQAGCAELGVHLAGEPPGLAAFCAASGFAPVGAGWARNLRKRA